MKLLIRRLPPGLTQEEFEETLGDEWRVGASRVSWTIYKPGKVSKECVKASFRIKFASILSLYSQSSKTISPSESLHSLD